MEKRMCPYCIDEFSPDDHVVQLFCHEAHVYHVKCIRELIKKRPLCLFCTAHIPFTEVLEVVEK